MTRIAIIVGSTRPGRNGTAVAEWVHAYARTRTDAEYELVDIEQFDLPLLDEPVPASMGLYSKDHTNTWAGTIGSSTASSSSPPSTTTAPPVRSRTPSTSSTASGTTRRPAS